MLAAALVLLLAVGHALADSFKDGLRLHGIKVVCAEEARPLFFPAPNGEPQGLVIDLWKAWSKKTGIPVRFVLAPWEEGIRSVLEGKADVLGSLVKNAERERRFDFSQPLFSAETVLIVQAGSGLGEKFFARDGIAGVIRKSFAEELHHKLYPKGALKTYLGQGDLTLAFFHREVDGMVAYLPAFSMYNCQREKPIYYEIAAVLDKSDICVAVRKGNARLLQEIDKGFSLISNYERKVMRNRWFVQGPAENETSSACYWICGGWLLVGITFLIIRMTRHPKH